MHNDLAAAFAILRRQARMPAGGEYAAQPIGQIEGHLAAITEAGLPCLLLKAIDVRQELLPPLLLRGLEIHYDVKCQVMLHGGVQLERQLTSIICKSQDPVEQEYFFHAADIMLRIIGPSPTVQQIASGTRHLANLFQRLSLPPRRSITGLIGELLFISIARSPIEAVKSWRVSDIDRFDFVSGNLRVDVKATEGRERAHYVSYEQANPPVGVVAILASLHVEIAGGGKTA